MTYIPTLLQRTKQLFLSLFQTYLQALVDSLSATSTTVSEASGKALKRLKTALEAEKWGKIFERCLRSCEGSEGTPSRTTKAPVSLRKQAQLASATSGESSPGESDDSATPLTAEEIAKNMQTLKSRIKPGRGKGRVSSPTASPKKTPSTAASKLMRKWGDSPVTKEDMAVLDYSNPGPTSDGEDQLNGTATPVDTEGLVSTDAMGKRGANGSYEVADWDFKADDLPTEDEILARGTGKMNLQEEINGDHVEESGSRWSSMFARLTGKKILTNEDLRPVLVEMERHLMSKNVAKDISEKLCDGVGAALVGKKLGGLASK